MIILKHFVQQKRKREKKDGAGLGWGGRTGEEKGFEKMEVEERGLKKRGVFDLKSRPSGNRGGVTHSNACPPPPRPLFQELQNGMKNGENKESRERESVGVCVCLCVSG